MGGCSSSQCMVRYMRYCWSVTAGPLHALPLMSATSHIRHRSAAYNTESAAKSPAASLRAVKTSRLARSTTIIPYLNGLNYFTICPHTATAASSNPPDPATASWSLARSNASVVYSGRSSLLKLDEACGAEQPYHGRPTRPGSQIALERDGGRVVQRVASEQREDGHPLG